MASSVCVCAISPEFSTASTPRHGIRPPTLSFRQLLGLRSSGKAACKAALQKCFRLPVDPESRRRDGVAARATKGPRPDRGRDARSRASQSPIRIPRRRRSGLSRHARTRPTRVPRTVRARLTFDNSVAHLIEAGADTSLMPSNYEPCGLSQMYSLRYGTPPSSVTRRPRRHRLRRTEPALETDAPTILVRREIARGARPNRQARYRNLSQAPGRLAQLQINGMNQDHSWPRPRANTRISTKPCSDDRRVRAVGIPSAASAVLHAAVEATENDSACHTTNNRLSRTLTKALHDREPSYPVRYLALFIGTFLEGETILIIAAVAASEGFSTCDCASCGLLGHFVGRPAVFPDRALARRADSVARTPLAAGDFESPNDARAASCLADPRLSVHVRRTQRYVVRRRPKPRAWWHFTVLNVAGAAVWALSFGLGGYAFGKRFCLS